MKIILVNNTFRPYQRGGAEIIVERLAEDWSAAGHEVVVVALEPKKDKKKIESNDTNCGYRVVRWPTNYYDLSNWPIWRKLLWHLADCLGSRHLAKWLKIISSFQPDLVVANNLTGLGFGLHFCCWRLKIPSVQILHDLQYLHPSGLMIVGQERIFQSWPAKIYQLMTANWLAAAKLLVSPSQWLIDYHRQSGWLVRARWLQLANPLAQSLAQQYRLPGQLRRAVFIGQLTEAKGVFWLAEQWAEFNRQLLASGFPEVDLTIIGDGPLDRQLRELADHDQRLIIMGRLNHEQVAKQLKSNDILLAPSFCYENWPTVLLEAATAGCLALVTSQGGGGELADRLGYLQFKAGNLDSLVAAWQKVATTAAKIDVWPASTASLASDSCEYLASLKKAL